jgi:predicted  nucleic acid-binding Zn-ribbon protein
MSPAVAVCARCGHVLAGDEALDPCPECGETERTLRREELVVDHDADEPETRRQVEERRPDGSLEIVQDEVAPDRA